MENSADGFLVTDLSGVITFCNRSAAKLLGRSIDEIVNQPVGAFLDETQLKEKEQVPTGVVAAASDGARPGQCTASGAKGSDSQQEGAQPFKSITVFGHNSIDMSVPANNFTILKKSGQPAGQLIIFYMVQAHSVQQAQTEFVSTVSHELRTPLTSIKGFADTILRAGDRLDHGQQRRYVGIIKDQADRLTRLVEDLLAVSRMESKKLQLTIRAIDLKEAIQRVHRNLAEKARHHKFIEIIPPGLPPVWADADRLEQILTNLIDNAIKYSPADTTVRIVVRDVPGTPEMVEFSISDQGVGIPQEHLPEIFSKFSRLDNPLTRQTEGTGLGLYITRSLVLALGGQIKVSSSPGSTTFTVQLPAASLEEQAARGRD